MKPIIEKKIIDCKCAILNGIIGFALLEYLQRSSFLLLLLWFFIAGFTIL